MISSMTVAPTGGRWVTGGVNNYFLTCVWREKKINIGVADIKKQCDQFYISYGNVVSLFCSYHSWFFSLYEIL